ncbi:MAG: hypothetical protein KJO07_24215 [Deltaproteobacteria bacterium]|nr:hypothetical protein [Deltaproteobacteria bacterium]
MSESELLARLRDLSLVDVDALLTGCDDDERPEVLASHVADLEDALAQVRAEMEAMHAALGTGGDPLAWVDWPDGKRSSDDGQVACARGAELLRNRAQQCRELAILAEAAASVVPRLLAAERR